MYCRDDTWMEKRNTKAQGACKGGMKGVLEEV